MTHIAKSEFGLGLVWLALVALTLLSFAVNAPTVVIVVALVKVRFVILDFMEARDAPWVLRLVLEGWVIGLATVLLIMFAGGRGAG